MAKYQNILDFLMNPFNRKSDIFKDRTYSDKYRDFVKSNKISIKSTCIIGDSYYLRIIIPSESNKNPNFNYDVIIRFFPESDEVKNQKHLRNYSIQFFSNSPSFMYQYAYLYRKNGYLIQSLYDKLDPDYIDKEPEKTNPNMVMSYDKSIYFACQYLVDTKFKYLDKSNLIFTIKKVPDVNFFKDISDFKSVKIEQSILSEEKRLSKLIESEHKQKERSKASKTKNNTSISIVKKINGKMKITSKHKVTPKKKI